MKKPPAAARRRCRARLGRAARIARAVLLVAADRAVFGGRFADAAAARRRGARSRHRPGRMARQMDFARRRADGGFLRRRLRAALVSGAATAQNRRPAPPSPRLARGRIRRAAAALGIQKRLRRNARRRFARNRVDGRSFRESRNRPRRRRRPALGERRHRRFRSASAGGYLLRRRFRSLRDAQRPRRACSDTRAVSRAGQRSLRKTICATP